MHSAYVFMSYLGIFLIIAIGIIIGHDISAMVKINEAATQLQQQILQTNNGGLGFQAQLGIAKALAEESWIPGLADLARGGSEDKVINSVMCIRDGTQFGYALGRGDLITMDDLDEAAGNSFTCTSQ
jgi:hypothetical protein